MIRINPTGLGIRNDAKGYGHHGAPRGNRKHDGVDLKCTKGQDILMPVDGIIVRESLPYKSDLKWRGVYIVNPRIEIKMWYLISDMIGKEIKVGSIIGEAQDIGEKYEGVTPHIHLRIVKIDPMLLFTEGGNDFDIVI
jgi:hypothetical protein